MRRLAAALAIVAALPGQALAWGPEGHRIVAEIAEQFLEPPAKREIVGLLALESAATLAEISSWADAIRSERPETAAWHFVNIPIHATAGAPGAYDAARDCPRGDCVVAAVDRFAAVLRDRAAPMRDRLEALKFVVHFVGDIHQPLNCADGDGSNGKDTHVIFLGQPTTLHAVWDTGILAAAGVGDARVYAKRLVQSIAPANLARWRGGSPAGWASESYGIARLIYGGSHEARGLQLFYETDFLPVVNVQLEKSGLRLAGVLNAALR